jgi:hypothetical protein
MLVLQTLMLVFVATMLVMLLVCVATMLAMLLVCVATMLVLPVCVATSLVMLVVCVATSLVMLHVCVATLLVMLVVCVATSCLMLMCIGPMSLRRFQLSSFALESSKLPALIDLFDGISQLGTPTVLSKCFRRHDNAFILVVVVDCVLSLLFVLVEVFRFRFRCPRKHIFGVVLTLLVMVLTLVLVEVFGKVLTLIVVVLTLVLVEVFGVVLTLLLVVLTTAAWC